MTTDGPRDIGREESHAGVERLFELAGRLLASTSVADQAIGREALKVATEAWYEHCRRFIAPQAAAG